MFVQFHLYAAAKIFGEFSYNYNKFPWNSYTFCADYYVQFLQLCALLKGQLILIPSSTYINKNFVTFPARLSFWLFPTTFSTCFTLNEPAWNFYLNFCLNFDENVWYSPSKFYCYVLINKFRYSHNFLLSLDLIRNPTALNTPLITSEIRLKLYVLILHVSPFFITSWVQFLCFLCNRSGQRVYENICI